MKVMIDLKAIDEIVKKVQKGRELSPSDVAFIKFVRFVWCIEF